MMKYAIYKGKIGLRAVEYIDTVEELKRQDLPYIKADRLPVIVNRMGGYSEFKDDCEKQNGFIEIVEVPEESYPLSREQMYPKNIPDFKYGYIDLEGNTYNTGHEGHFVAAEFICKENGWGTYQAEQALEKMGWVKTTARWEKGVLSPIVFCEKNHITRLQYEALAKANLECVEHVPFYKRVSEPEW